MAVELKRRRFTLDEYRRMVGAGILTKDDRVELIEGEIVEMAPMGPEHGSVVTRLNYLLLPATVGRAVVWIQCGYDMAARDSQFQPDVAVLRPRVDFYRPGNPDPADALLVIEVMWSSEDRDRRVKLPIYASTGTAEVWLVDVAAELIEVYRRPSGIRYEERTVLGRREVISPQAFPDLRLAVADILG
jgi:Uma2 family endonuclease